MSTQLSLVDGGIFTARQLFAIENWTLQGRSLARELKAFGKDTEKSEGKLLWELGDWLINGELDGKMGKDKLRKCAVAATGFKWNYLKQLKVVSRAIPPSRRRNDLSYSMHREVCPADEATQERLLTEAARRQATRDPMSVREIRKEVKKQIGSIGSKGSSLLQKKMGGAGEIVKIALSMENYNQLYRLQRDFNCGGNVGDVMFLIVRTYIKQNSSEIKARRAEYERAMEEWRNAPRHSSPERKAYDAWYTVEHEKWKAACKERRSMQLAGKSVPPEPLGPKWIANYEWSSRWSQPPQPRLPGMEETPEAAAVTERLNADSEQRYKIAMEEWVQAHQSLISKHASPTAAELHEPEDPDDLRPPTE
jgi:hypothetical protein